MSINVFETATNHLTHLANGDYTARELLDAHVQQIAQHDKEINAVVWSDVEAAAQLADQTQGQAGGDQPLLGLSMTVKEAFDLTGSPTTWGIPELANNIASTDSVVVERLRRAGAIVFGKTNVPLNLADLQSYNDIYGQCNNPWDLSRTPGGSSGGSGAALAAGYAALEMGSDIGGSIRTPSHFNGVFGHKPTFSLIPVRGHNPPGTLAEPDIAVVGPMARSAFDLELLLDVLAKPDALQPGVSYDLKGLEGRTLGDLKVAVWLNDEVAPVSKDIEAGVRRVADTLASAGASVDYDARPKFSAAHSHTVYSELLWSFMSAGTPDDQFEDMQAQAANLAPDADDEASRLLRSATLTHRDWVRYNNERDGLRWAWHDFFKDYDVLLAPQTATTAMRHDHGPMSERTLDVDGTSQPYFQQIFWAGLIGISWLPSTVIPSGVASDGLPVGVQIVGHAYHDRLTIQVAQALEREGFTFTVPLRMAG